MCAEQREVTSVKKKKQKQKQKQKRFFFSFCYCMLTILQWDLKDVGMVIKACHVSTGVRSEHLYVCCCSPGPVAHRGSPKADKKSQAAVRAHLEQLESPAGDESISCRSITFFRIASVAWLWSAHPEEDPVTKGWKKSASHCIFIWKWDHGWGQALVPAANQRPRGYCNWMYFCYPHLCKL